MLRSQNQRILGNWRYDESMARAGVVLTSPARDGRRTYSVRISGWFEPFADCRPW
jgi:hypothetical protein